MLKLTSPQNPLLKEIRKAVHRGGLTASGSVVAEGIHLLEEARRAGCAIEAVVATESAAAEVEATHIAPEPLFTLLSSTESSQGVIALVRPPAWTFQDILRAPALV